MGQTNSHALKLDTPPNLMNVDTGVDHTIREIAEIVKQVVGFHGKIANALNMPDGTPKKLLDVSRLNRQGRRSKIPLEQGIELTYQDYLKQIKNSTTRLR